VALSVFAAGIGATLFLTHAFDNFLLHTPSLAAGWAQTTDMPGKFHWDVAGYSTVIAVAGVVCALYLYLGERNEVSWLYHVMNWDWMTRASEGSFLNSIRSSALVSRIYRAASAVGLGWLAALIGDIVLLLAMILAIPLFLFAYISPYRLSYGKFFFDELYLAFIVWPLRAIAQLAYWFDRWVIDGLVNLCGRVPTAFGGLMRSMQFGLMPFYALAMVLGTLVLLAARMLWAG
jgi:NADH-quinone oxidoreductase subunit L